MFHKDEYEAIVVPTTTLFASKMQKIINTDTKKQWRFSKNRSYADPYSLHDPRSKGKHFLFYFGVVSRRLSKRVNDWNFERLAIM